MLQQKTPYVVASGRKARLTYKYIGKLLGA